MHLPRLLLPLGLCLTASCGGKNAYPQEQITSLRTFGVSANPLVNSPSIAGQTAKTVELTFSAAVPKGQTATLTPYVDAASSDGAVTVPTSDYSVVASDVYMEYAGFRLYQTKVKVNLPTAEAFHQGTNFVGGQLRYGLTVTTADDHEDLVGDLVIFPAGAAELAWTNPTVDIPTPAINTTVSINDSIDLKASIANTNSEQLKIGWFVTDGDVSNRRAAETTWKLKDTGTQTIAVTIHGSQSRGFGVKVMDVTAN